MEELRGIVLYTIERDNNLNGVYTNNQIPNAQIFTETARRTNEIDINNGDELREYNFFYFDVNDLQVNGTLTFTIVNGTYNAEWRVDREIWFLGRGFQMSDNQIAISYWGVGRQR